MLAGYGQRGQLSWATALHGGHPAPLSVAASSPPDSRALHGRDAARVR